MLNLQEQMALCRLNPITHTAPDGSPLANGEFYMRRELFGDYSFDAFIEGNEALTLYLFCNRFSQFMDRVQHGFQGMRFDNIKARKLCGDREGTLSFVAPGIEKNGYLLSGAILISTETLGKNLDQLNNPQDVHSLLYGSKLKNFFPKIEGVWAYMFLLFDMGLNQSEVLTRVLEEKHADVIASGWRLKGDVDQQTVSMLYEAFNQISSRSLQ